MRRKTIAWCFPLALSLLGLALAAVAQQPANSAGEKDVRNSYKLGPDDQISIRVPDAEEISDKPVRLDTAGYIHLPMVGRLQAAGLTAEQLEHALAERLKVYMVEPEVSVSVIEFRSQPVSVVGSVKSPGIVQLQGHKTLIEVLSLAGGLTEDAGHTIKITRQLEQGRIPLPGATDDSTGKYSVAEVSIKGIMEAVDPAANIEIKPEDVITVPRGEMIYVVGQVTKPGGFVLRERQSLSVLQALAVAGGLDKAAAPQHARILRAEAGQANRVEIPVDLRKVMQAHAEDLPLHADDILLIPPSKAKQALTKGIEAAISIGTGLVIYRM